MNNTKLFLERLFIKFIPVVVDNINFNNKFMEEPIVKVEHLSHRYSIQWAVRDISFEIPRRGIYGLLGSNGAGKSTTMNIISGVIKQTEGQVLSRALMPVRDRLMRNVISVFYRRNHLCMVI